MQQCAIIFWIEIDEDLHSISMLVIRTFHDMLMVDILFFKAKDQMILLRFLFFYKTSYITESHIFH